jgi:hypothetical protein
MFTIPTADDLVTFIKDFTGSTNDAEVKKCIFMAEMSMRNIELPALRCDPYAPENIGIADAFGRVPIPGDMNKPILFFKQGQQYLTQGQATGVVGESTITMITTPTKSLQVGMVVVGSGIASGATIVGFPSPDYSVIELSTPNTGEVSGIVVFQTLANKSNQTGPWIVYDRIGDRDIITQGMIAQLYLQPVNVPAVIRGKFSEVGQYYEFLPYVAEGDLINMYYYKAWPLLFSPVNDPVISEVSYVASFTSTGTGTWDVAVTGMTSTSGLTVGDTINVNRVVGEPAFISNTNTGIVKTITSDTEIVVSVTSTLEPVGGTTGAVTIIGLDVQSNAVLATWPEGYVYATLREYYIKRHNSEDAAVYQAKFQDAWNVIEDQNNLGKWSGGHTRMSSIWQPRQYRQYNIK